MHKQLSLLTIILLTTISLKAQTKDSTAAKPEPRPKWEFAINIWPVIQDIKARDAGLMVRKHYLDAKGKPKALRFSVNNFSQSIIFSENWTERIAHFNSFDLAFGKEWQRPSGKFITYYGWDVRTGLNWNRDVNIGSGTLPDEGEYLYGRGSFISVFGSISSFLGAKYVINSYLSLSLESSIYYILADQKRYSEYFNADNKLIKKDNYDFYTRHTIDIKPIYNFNISYYFN